MASSLICGRLCSWERRFEGSGPAAELALDGEGVVSVFKADFAEGNRLTSLRSASCTNVAV